MGGSTATQKINCPGSHALEKLLITQEVDDTSEYALIGTVSHAALELLIQNDPETPEDLTLLCEDLVGQNMGIRANGEKPDENRYAITQAQVDKKIRPAFEAWQMLRDKYKFQDWLIEHRVSLDEEIPGAFGTGDFYAYDAAGDLHYLDWKFGDGVKVKAEENYSCAFYSAGLLLGQDEDSKDFIEHLKEESEGLRVYFHIVQPFRDMTDAEDVVDTWETNEDYLNKFLRIAAEAHSKAIALLDVKDAKKIPVKAGYWCQWCPVKVQCPGHQSTAEKVLEKSPDNMTAIELGYAVSLAERVDVWSSAVKKFAQQQAEAGVNIPGRKLVQKRAERKWVDEYLVEKKRKSLKLTKKLCYTEPSLKSPAQFEKTYPAEYKKYFGLNDPKISLVEKKSSGYTLVSDTDKRPSVTVDGVVELGEKIAGLLEKKK